MPLFKLILIYTLLHAWRQTCKTDAFTVAIAQILWFSIPVRHAACSRRFYFLETVVALYRDNL